MHTTHGLNSLGSMIFASRDRFPQRPALLVPVGKEFETVTYTDFIKKIEAFAGFLVSKGLVKDSSWDGGEFMSGKFYLSRSFNAQPTINVHTKH